jgi:hypothetical protein
MTSQITVKLNSDKYATILEELKKASSCKSYSEVAACCIFWTHKWIIEDKYGCADKINKIVGETLSVPEDQRTAENVGFRVYKKFVDFHYGDK